MVKAMAVTMCVYMLSLVNTDMVSCIPGHVHTTVSPACKGFGKANQLRVPGYPDRPMLLSRAHDDWGPIFASTGSHHYFLTIRKFCTRLSLRHCCTIYKIASLVPEIKGTKAGKKQDAE